MAELIWQKSSFSEAGGANRLYVTASSTPAALAVLIRTLAPTSPVRMT